MAEVICAKCGSDRVLGNGFFELQGASGMSITFATESTLFALRKASSPLNLHVCVDCGYTEMYAKDTEKLRQAFPPPA